MQLPGVSTEADNVHLLSNMAKNVLDADLRIHPKHSIKWVIPTTVTDADAASLFYVASKAICPTAKCDLTVIANRPALLAAVLKWAAPRAVHILIQLTPETSQPYIWQLLRQTPHVDSVTLIVEEGFQETNRRGKLVAHVCDAVCSAAEHLVEPAFRPGESITFVTEIGTPKDKQSRKKHVRKISEFRNESLPDTVQLSGVHVYDTDWELTLKKWYAKATMTCS